MSATTMSRVEARDRESMAIPTATGWPKDRTWLWQATVSAVLMAFLLNERYGYTAGDNDHAVLSPLGMQWAKPGWFANDWTIANAPQPHWFFDMLTWLGTKTGTLAAIYLLYFAASMFVYGVATTLLARKWTPRHSWYAVIAVTTVAAIGPLYLLGSGVLFWPMALPGVLGGLLLYLTTAALLVGRHRLAAVAGVAVAVIHVQVGVIAVVLLASMAVVVYRRSRRLDIPLVAATVISAIVCVVALKVRPVAGSFSDFARICDEIIPYHCNSASWTSRTIIGGFAVLGIALLTFFYLGRNSRAQWILVLVVPAAGLVAGTLANAWRIPGLGMLAQGTNVYRLADIFTPFLAWGLVTPIFARGGSRLRWGLLGAVVAAWFLTLRTDDWGLTAVMDISAEHWVFGIVFALVLACAVLTVPDLVARPERWRRAAAVLLAVSSLSSIYMGASHTTWLRPFRPGVLQTRPDYISWGAQVEKAVPVGSTIMVPPAAIYARIASKRAIVADCKYGPYGGEAATEYRRRIMDLGGFDQCTLHPEPYLSGYAVLTADQLEADARKYGATYIGLAPEQAYQARQLQQRGWTRVVAMPNPWDMQPADRVKYVFIDIWRAPGS